LEAVEAADVFASIADIMAEMVAEDGVIMLCRGEMGR